MLLLMRTVGAMYGAIADCDEGKLCAVPKEASLTGSVQLL
jgi:hypothetical protein